MYSIAFNLIQKENTIYDKSLRSIYYWILAYNALQNGGVNKNYTITEINELPQTELNELAKVLGVKNNNINTIINVLDFMGKLRGDLNFEINMDLYRPLLLNSSFDNVIDLLKSKKSLKPLVIELLPRIIEYNDIGTTANSLDDNIIKFLIKLLQIGEMHIFDQVVKLHKPFIIHSNFNKIIHLLETKKWLKPLIIYFMPEIIDYNSSIIDADDFEDIILNEFIPKLINIKELDVYKAAFTEWNNTYDINHNLQHDRFIEQFTANELLDEYFKLLPENYKEENLSNSIGKMIKYIYESSYSSDVYYYLISKMLNYAIENKKIFTLITLKSIEETTAEYYFSLNKNQISNLESLFDEADKLLQHNIFGIDRLYYFELFTLRELLDTYFEIIPNNYSESNLIDSLLHMINYVNETHMSQVYVYMIQKVLGYAINNKKIKLLKKIVDIKESSNKIFSKLPKYLQNRINDLYTKADRLFYIYA
jgi:hypothetical protein